MLARSASPCAQQLGALHTSGGEWERAGAGGSASCSVSGRGLAAPLQHRARRRPWQHGRVTLGATSSSSSSSSISSTAGQQQQPPFAVPPPPPPPPMAGSQGTHTSHTQDLYLVTDEPITRFGFARGFEDKYELDKVLGQGTFGTVYVGIDKQTGERFAVKRMPKKWQGAHLEQYYVRRVVNEVDICRHLGPSLSVCYFVEAFEDDKNVDLVMELCTGGQLWDRIKEGTYSERAAAQLVRAILRAIAQCHGLGVLLRDVKPENFMFLGPEEDSPLKAIDFGISVFCRPGQYIDVRAGTPIYIAPEVLKMRYTFSADIWSAGIIAYQLLTGRLPFAGEDGSEVAELYMEKQKFVAKDAFRAVLYSDLDFESAPWDLLSPAAKEFVQSLLQRDESLRPTAEQALQHPWLADDEECAASDAPLSGSVVQRLQRYGTYGQFRKAVLRQVAHATRDEGQLAELRALFRSLDTNGSGLVSTARLRGALLDAEQFNIRDEEAEQLLEQLDLDHTHEIDVDEFLAALVDWRDVRTTGEWDRLITDAFRSIDLGSDGSLGPEDLEALLCGEEGCAFPDTVDAALREADTDHDGRVSLEEFKAFMSAQQDEPLELFDSRRKGSRDGSGSDSGSGSDAS